METHGASDTTASDGTETRPTASRRRLLQTVGGAAALSTLVGHASARGDSTDTPTGTADEGTGTPAAEGVPILLGGRTAYWLGLEPLAIEGQRNPTLQLRPEEQYRLVWLNLDGQPHQWQLLDGEDTVLTQTEPTRTVGATASVTVAATEELATYRCKFHPEQMTGGVELGEGFPDVTPQTTTDSAGTATAGGGQTVDVAVGPSDRTLRFVPEEVEIAVGDTVRWTAESPGHNVSCKPEVDRRVELPDGAEPFASYEGTRSFSIMEVGSTFEHTFTVPGTYVYVCVPHVDQGMIARVVVTE